MQNFRRILVGVDLAHGDRLAAAELEPPSEEAVRRALWLAGQLPSAEILFLSVLEVSPQTEDALKAQSNAGQRNLLDEAADALDRVVDRAQQAGLKSVRRHLALGRPWEQICREVPHGGHDLVIIGTGRHGTAARLLFGTTALKLMRHCPAPVWIAKPDTDWSDLNILVASDFSETCDEALRIGVQAGQLSGAKLHVLHALERDFERRMDRTGLRSDEVVALHEQDRQEAERKLHGQLAQTDYRTLAHGVKVHVVDGPADSAILDAIRNFGIDLLIMGTQARSGLSGMILGNTAEQLLPQIPCSVLVVKPRGFEYSVT